LKKYPLIRSPRNSEKRKSKKRKWAEQQGTQTRSNIFLIPSQDVVFDFKNYERALKLLPG